MSAFKARKPTDTSVAPKDALAAPRVRLADGADPSVSSGAHALQAQLQTRLKARAAPADLASPSRGILIAAVPSALLWWGVISGVRALMHLGS